MYLKISKLALPLLLLAVVNSCVKKEFDEPPEQTIPEGNLLTIADLRQIYADAVLAGYNAVKFTGDLSFYATVVMDETSGNIYKSSYVMDNTGGINLHLMASGGLYEGDYVRVYLKNLVLSNYNGLLQVDSVDVDYNVIKQQTGIVVEPKLVAYSELLTDQYQSQLIRLEGVQFVSSALGNTYADAANLTSVNWNIENCDGLNSIIVRTSGYAKFADQLVPEGNGSIIAVASIYSGDIQLYIRRTEEIDMTGERCGTNVQPVETLEEHFDNAANYTDISISGWNNLVVSGDRRWQGKEYNEERYAQATGYNSGLTDMETWLITPPVINTEGNKVLTFNCAQAYWLHSSFDPVTVLASVDFDGINVGTATWTELDAVLPDASSPNYEWIASGEISLSSFTGNVFIAFKYKGSNEASTSIQIDDVIVITGSGGGPVTSLDEDFGSETAGQDITLTGWYNMAQTGTRRWQGKELSGNICAAGRSVGSGGDNAMWLITPPINLDAMTNPVFTFSSAQQYWVHDGLSLWISNDFNGTDPASATWTPLTCNLAGQFTPYSQWVPSGNISLSEFSGVAYVGFLFQGNETTETTTYMVDDVILEDQ